MLVVICHGLSYNFSAILQASSARVCCEASVYTVSLHICGTSQVRSRFTFSVI